MGQAKLRGSREERVQEGIAKRALEAAERERRRRQYWASLTPRQRRRLREIASVTAMFGGQHMHLTDALRANENEQKRLAGIR